MPTVKEKKGKNKKSAKKPKVIPDPDEKYRSQLDSEFYVPKLQRERKHNELAERVKRAISAFDTSGTAGENSIPLLKVPLIVRSLGLCPTGAQLKQIEAMVCSQTSLPQGGSQADYDKLVNTLVQVLETRILAYDPQVLVSPPSEFPDRVSSVLCSLSEERIRVCFDSLWKICGSRVTSSEDGEARYIDSNELQKIALDSPELITGEDQFTDKEIEEFLLTFKSTDSDIIREDTFLLSLLHVN